MDGCVSCAGVDVGVCMREIQTRKWFRKFHELCLSFSISFGDVDDDGDRVDRAENNDKIAFRVKPFLHIHRIHMKIHSHSKHTHTPIQHTHPLHNLFSNFDLRAR